MNGRREALPDKVHPKRENTAGGFQQTIFDWLQVLVAVLVIVIGTFAFLVSIVGVDGSSMYPTLHNGDLLLMQRIAYTPTQGDVVVLHKVGTFEDRSLVKRVIATGGQTVYIDYDNNTITVNGELVDEPYLNYEFDDRYGSDFLAIRSDLNENYVNQEFTVPDGCVFVCGDNRNHSSDSRVAELDMVDEQYILGRVLFVLFPFSHFGLVR